MRRLDNNLSTNSGVKLLKTFKVKNTKIILVLKMFSKCYISLV